MQPADFKIIGLSGTNGSGKDTVGGILAEKHGFLFISVTELLRSEAKKRGLSVERENLRSISAEWRRESGLGVLIDKAIAEYMAVKGQYKGLAVASLRNPGEADRVHEYGGIVVWIDADTKFRYDRIQANKDHRGRLEEDNKTYDQFMTEEAQEMKQGGDEATLNMLGVKQKSDKTLINEFENEDQLKEYLAKEIGL
jgi:cytidylate kinase